MLKICCNRIIQRVFRTSQDSCFQVFVFIKLLKEKLGNRHVTQIRCIHLFIKYLVNMFVSIYICPVTIHEFWVSVTVDFIMSNIGKRFVSEMGYARMAEVIYFL